MAWLGQTRWSRDKYRYFRRRRLLSAGVDIENPTRSRSFDKNSPAYEKTHARRKSVGVFIGSFDSLFQRWDILMKLLSI